MNSRGAKGASPQFIRALSNPTSPDGRDALKDPDDKIKARIAATCAVSDFHRKRRRSADA